MPKHKKTRQEKIKTEERRNISLQNNGLYSFTLSETNSFPTTVIKSSYVSSRNDLVKTGIISSVILFLEIIFYFLLRTHTLAFPFVRY